MIANVIQAGESMIEHRLPLDSGEWKSSPSMWNANQRLQALLQSDTPIPESIVDFIYEFEGCDCFERSYYYALPYLADYLCQHRESLLEVFPDFCNPLMTANSIPDDCKAQIRLAREQIVNLMLFALEDSSSETDSSYGGSCLTYVAGIAAVYTEAYVARQIAMPD